jgi:hypothetical protein
MALLLRLCSVSGPGHTVAPHFYARGVLNFGTALTKSFSLGETKALQFRLETFNTFNIAQFFGAAAANGEITSSAFGRVVSAMTPRPIQAAVTVSF